MRTIFGFLLLIHGLIHLIGFIKAFEFAEIDQLNQNISKSSGVIWLLAVLLFLFTSLLLFLRKDYWTILAFTSVILSQILIFNYWKDAKFGTIANIIIVLVSISAYGTFKFNKMVQKESLTLLEKIDSTPNIYIKAKDIRHVPPIIQQWMQYSGVMNKEVISTVRLKQIGKMRTKPDSKWMHFSAQQFFDIKNPSFIWNSTVKVMPLIVMNGRDKFINNEGEMLIKLAGLIPVVSEGENEMINQSTMLRFLAEICWFPSAALNKYIKWEEINSTSLPFGQARAKATFTLNKNQVSGIFKFSQNGKFLSFITHRYYGGGLDSKLEEWYIEALDYKNFGDYNIPFKCKVIWKLKEGDFEWLNLELVEVFYNKEVHKQ